MSFDAANGVGAIYSPRVTMSGSEITFDEFASGAWVAGYMSRKTTVYPKL